MVELLSLAHLRGCWLAASLIDLLCCVEAVPTEQMIAITGYCIARCGGADIFYECSKAQSQQCLSVCILSELDEHRLPGNIEADGRVRSVQQPMALHCVL